MKIKVVYFRKSVNNPLGGDELYNYTIEYAQEYNHYLSQKYKALCVNYDKLKNEVDKLYKNNLSNESYKHKLLNHVDDVAVNENSKEIFKKYEIDKKEIIKRYLDNYFYLNENNISNIFSIREKMLNKKINSLNLNNIGTSLNILREFYNDIQIDIERNKKNEVGDHISYKESLFLEMPNHYNQYESINNGWNIKVGTGEK